MNMPHIRIWLHIVVMLFLLWSCSNSQSGEESKISAKKWELKKPIPVGMVDASLRIKEVIERNDKLYSVAEIVKVHGYGNSVKALSEKITYEFEISDDLSDYFIKDLASGTIIWCRLLKMSENMERSGPDKLKIVSVKTQ